MAGCCRRMPGGREYKESKRSAFLYSSFHELRQLLTVFGVFHGPA